MNLTYFNPVVYNSHVSELIHPIDKKSIAAIKLTRQLSEKVDADAAKAIFEAETPLSYRQMAELLLPEDFNPSPDIAGHAVGIALREIIPPEIRIPMVKSRQATFLKNTMARLTPEEYSLHQSTAAAASNRKSPRNAREIVEDRGMTRYSEEEKNEIINVLAKQSDFLYQSGGRNKLGKPDTRKIAKQINTVFHGGEDIRTPMAIRELLRKV